jgi:short-subunit dehydrogenase
MRSLSACVCYAWCLGAAAAAPWSKQAAAPPPPPPPPPAAAELFAAVLGALLSVPWALIVLYTCAAFGLLSLASYLVPLALANARGYNDLKRRYRAEWACVTGASSGIGKELAVALARQGINVILVALDDELLVSATADLSARFPERRFRPIGVNLSAADGAYMRKIESGTRDVHVSLLFNNAGYMLTGFFHHAPTEKHLANVHCNAISALLITHHFLNRMYASGRPGLVCFTSSAAAYIPSPFTAMYSATKAFISRFATSLAVEARPQGVDVIAVHPSPVGNTNFLKGTARIRAADAFYKVATGPEAVPPQIFALLGRGLVLADLGPVAVLMRLLTKLIDDSLFAFGFAFFAPGMPDYREHAAAAGLKGHL